MLRLLVLIAACASACAPAGPQELQIVSTGGPIVAVIVINDEEVARIAELPRWLVIFQDSAGVSASPILGPVIPCVTP